MDKKTKSFAKCGREFVIKVMTSPYHSNQSELEFDWCAINNADQQESSEYFAVLVLNWAKKYFYLFEKKIIVEIVSLI